VREGERFGVRTVAYALGWELVILAAAMVAPLAVDYGARSTETPAFLAATATTLFVGVALILACRAPRHALSLRTAFLMTAASWLVLSGFAALPFILGDYTDTVTDAVFEAVSALTTTGSTVLSGLDRAPPGLLLWRSLLQWVGGIGIIVMALVLLPFLRIGGMQLFRSESSDRSEKLLPTTAAFVTHIVAIYASLTLLLVVLLTLSGMSLFDAVNHAFTSIATGGFSTRDASIGAFSGAAIPLVLLFGMLAGAMPFARYVALVSGRWNLFWQDRQLRLLLLFLTAVILPLALWLSLTQQRPFADALLAAAFSVVSVVTTTGYATEDYTLWGTPVVSLFLVLTVMGGCTGSTSGGIKMFRFQILWIVTRDYLEHLFLPRRVTSRRYAGRPVTGEVAIGVLSFVFLFVGSWALFTVLLGALGLDPLTAISAAATAVANVGPGLGPVIGPSGNFASLPDAAKWLLVLAMLLGRLEFFTLLVLLHPSFWRR